MTMTAPSATAPADTTVERYGSALSGFDEMVDASGNVRPHWREFMAAVTALTPDERKSRAARLDTRIRDTGITHDIFADPRKPRPRWQLDLLPVVVSASEWRWLSSALNQRARLFAAILSDIYGSQKLLRDGLIPPELVFSDTAYLPPCNGILPNAGPLQFYAADIARGPDGRWRVIDSHTETLAGVGFALANRVAHTHVAGDLFKQANAIRLAAYFQKMQAALTAHGGRENARIALLTPGPHHDDYFSHAYLARYLGYLLVEGSDLRTRGSQIYLKTLEGLKEIDLVVRCVDGRMSDPLELDPTGFDGPAGMLRVCRRTPRLVVNAVGSAVVQNRGLGAFLPAVSRHLLGEELMIEDAPRLWLGEAANREHVLSGLDSHLIRKAQEGTGRPGRAALGQDPRALSTTERETLRRDIELHGARLVAEASVGFSTAPSLGAGGFEPRPFALRLFVSHTSGGYETMPGGLAMTVNPQRSVALSAPDGHTRDVWVVSENEQAPHISLWRPMLENARVERSQRVIQSRVADDLFWLGRYAERADWIMRVVRSALRRIEEDAGPVAGRRAATRCVKMLLEGSKPQSPQANPRGMDNAPDTEVEELCRRVVSGTRGPRTLDLTFEGLYRVAFLARDRLSLEAWQTLSRLRPGGGWATSIASAKPSAVLDLLDEGLAHISAFNGLMHENMTRNFGWSFLDMGRRVERAYNLSEAIVTLFHPRNANSEEEAGDLLLLLELADSFITYRSRYRLDPMLALVLDLLLIDEANPRSLAYQLAAVSKHMEQLPDSRQGVSLSEDRRLMLQLLTSIRLADIEAIARDETGRSIEKLLREQLKLLPDFSDALARHYFNLVEDAPHRAQTRFEQPA